MRIDMKGYVGDFGTFGEKCRKYAAPGSRPKLLGVFDGEIFSEGWRGQATPATTSTGMWGIFGIGEAWRYRTEVSRQVWSHREPSSDGTGEDRRQPSAEARAAWCSGRVQPRPGGP